MVDSPAPWERDFAAYVDGRGGALRATAYLLCGDRHAAEDLTQAALAVNRGRRGQPPVGTAAPPSPGGSVGTTEVPSADR